MSEIDTETKRAALFKEIAAAIVELKRAHNGMHQLSNQLRSDAPPGLELVLLTLCGAGRFLAETVAVVESHTEWLSKQLIAALDLVDNGAEVQHALRKLNSNQVELIRAQDEQINDLGNRFARLRGPEVVSAVRSYLEPYFNECGTPAEERDASGEIVDEGERDAEVRSLLRAISNVLKGESDGQGVDRGDDQGREGENGSDESGGAGAPPAICTGGSSVLPGGPAAI